MTGIIPLNKGRWAAVSDCDFIEVKQYKWFVHADTHNIYARARVSSSKILLHRFIMKPPPGLEIHHKDGNGLNCERDNLVMLSHKENMRFYPRNRGVDFERKAGKFRARVTINYKQHLIGYFNSKEEAVLAYNEACKQLLGEGNFEPNTFE